MQATFDELPQTVQIEKGEDIITESSVRQKFNDPRLLVRRDVVAHDGGEASSSLLGDEAPQIFEGGVGDRIGIGFHVPG